MPRTVTPEPTPNPNALRFTLAGVRFGERSRTYDGAAGARGVPWVERLFSIPGIVSVLAVRDFVTVTKEPHADWEAIVPHVVEVLADAQPT